MNNPTTLPVLKKRKNCKDNNDEFYWVAPKGSAGKEEGSGNTKENRRRANMRKWKREMLNLEMEKSLHNNEPFRQTSFYPLYLWSR